MEEDPESEWGIQEYSCSKEVETSMMKWILNKGYGIGKKMIITGIAISAAPLVLPPIVVFSAMGVAFSVPSGLAFAIYTCTNKLMRTLLPTPPSPVLLLQYYSDGDEQEKEKGVELDDEYARVENVYYMGGYGDDYGREVEFLVSNADGNTDEKGYCYSDEKEGFDVDYELEDVGDEFRQYVGASITNLNENEEEIVQPDDYKEEGEGLIMHLDEIVIERSYYTNENENENEFEDVVVPIEDDVLRRENVVIEEEVIVGKGCYDDVNKEVHADHYNEGGEALLMNVDEIKDEKKHEIDDEKEREDDVLQRENVTEEDETEQMEDIKREVETSLGLDVGSVKNFGGGVDEQGYEEDVGEYLQGDDDSLGEENMGEDLSSQMYEIKNNIQEGEKEEVVEESTRLLEESPSNVASEEVKDFETTEPVIVKKIDSEKLIQNGIKDNECVGELSHVLILAGGHEGNNFNSREVEELDLVAREVDGDSEAHGRKDESDEKVMRESMGTQEKTISDRISNDGAKNVILETTKEKLISSNIDAREISNESAGVNFENLEADGEVKENAADKNVDVLALPAPGQATLEADNRKVSTKNDTNMPTKEDILEDEKIWEKIGAMRAIVGYKVPSQPTCIEELKALYVFTGVEPPVSFNVDSGLDEVNDKLKFLMSIVGVK